MDFGVQITSGMTFFANGIEWERFSTGRHCRWVAKSPCGEYIAKWGSISWVGQQCFSECFFFEHMILEDDKSFFSECVQGGVSGNQVYVIQRFVRRDENCNAQNRLPDALKQIADFYKLNDILNRGGDNWFFVEGNPVIVDYGIESVPYHVASLSDSAWEFMKKDWRYVAGQGFFFKGEHFTWEKMEEMIPGIASDSR